ncbi:MAG: cytochrome c-type biogenesis protein CcmH [Xanthomonadales bacterium]|nr:cytochrome c-type biogenesis protein CcmH [Xanthomonadales bacterium]ODU93950.1 MAG: cytochrome C biogenesis protein [Rhodanobacter sp. SCN 66-43]OJY82657.1 MAG: cytochrome C biogenesis protein [Xanthomonadales bacterium 66-474]
MRHSWLRWIVAAILMICAIAPAVAIDPLPFQNEAQRDRFQHLTGELRCMVCQDESLLASNADFAKQLRRQIFDMMQQGKSDKEIKDWLVARYSTFILYDPPLAPSTIALWFGTPAILLIGAGVVVVLLRRRTRPSNAIAEEPGDDW